MLKICFALLFLFTAKLYSEELFPYDEIVKFKWSDIEAKVSLTVKQVKAEKRKIVKALFKTGYFEQFDWDKNYLNRMRDSIHFVNINSDENIDVIYTGEYQGEGNITILLLNMGEKYKSIFNENGKPCKFIYENNIIKRLFIVNEGCCASPDTYLFTYEFSNTVEGLKFKTIFSSTIVTGSKMPNSLLSKPFIKNIVQKKVHLRSSPVLKNYPYDDFLIQYGNRIGVLKENTPVKVIAEQKDNKGNTWCFVEIAAQYKIYNTVFYSPEYFIKLKKSKELYAGWVHSKAFVTPVLPSILQLYRPKNCK